MELTFENILKMFYYKHLHHRTETFNPELKVLLGMSSNPNGDTVMCVANIYQTLCRGGTLASCITTKERLSRLRPYLMTYRVNRGFETTSPIYIRGSNLKLLAIKCFDLGVQDEATRLQIHRACYGTRSNHSFYLVADTNAALTVKDLSFSGHEMMLLEEQLNQVHKLANQLRAA